MPSASRHARGLREIGIGSFPAPEPCSLLTAALPGPACRDRRPGGILGVGVVHPCSVLCGRRWRSRGMISVSHFVGPPFGLPVSLPTEPGVAQTKIAREPQTPVEECSSTLSSTAAISGGLTSTMRSFSYATPSKRVLPAIIGSVLATVVRCSSASSVVQNVLILPHSSSGLGLSCPLFLTFA